MSSTKSEKPARRRHTHLLRRLARNEDGSTAIEFAVVGLPFIMLLFGIIVLGLYFFITFSLENAVERAGRLIRTGQAQTAGMTTDQFKTQVCNNAPTISDCAQNVRVNVASWDGFGDINPPTCTNGATGELIPEPAVEPVPGAAGAVVLITVCYEWELAASIPFLRVGKMGNGSALIQASTTFRTEPYQ